MHCKDNTITSTKARAASRFNRAIISLVFSISVFGLYLKYIIMISRTYFVAHIMKPATKSHNN